MFVSVYQPPDYFDLITRDVSEIEIKEKLDKSTCLISLIKDSGVHFKGFKLSDKPEVNVCVDVVFFPSKVSGKYIPRLTFHKVDKTFTTKEQKGKEKVIINLDDSTTAENFWKVIGFLFTFKDLVDHDAFHRSFKVVDEKAYILEFDTKEKADKIRVLADLVDKSDLSEDQIELVLKQNREKVLEGFRRMLDDEPGIWEKYREKYKDEIKGAGEEAIWHHFLKKHHWILGLNIDVRFIRDLVPEGNVGITNTEGRGSPNADFIGIRDYTSLIEVKTPKTKIFTDNKKSTARTNTWSFSSDFIDGVSQCLGQKFDWDKSHKAKDLVSDGEVIDQDLVRTVDPKAIFLIGNTSEFPESSRDTHVLIKRDTFERFRRNCRNIEILTFDELYGRSYFIVYGKEPASE